MENLHFNRNLSCSVKKNIRKVSLANPGSGGRLIPGPIFKKRGEGKPGAFPIPLGPHPAKADKIT